MTVPLASDVFLTRPVTSPLAQHDFRPIFRLFWFSLALILIANAYNIFSYPYSIDAEVNTFSPNPVEFVGSGRWAAFLLAKYVVPFAAIPVVPILIACTTFSAAYVVTVHTWNDNIGWPHYLAAPVALCHPLLFQLFSFSVISYSVGTAVFMTALALHLLSRPSRAHFFVSIPLLVFAFGVYQPVILYPCAAFIVQMGLGLTRQGLRATLRLALLIGAALLLAVLLNRGITEAGYRLAGVTMPYTDAYYDFGYLQHHPLRVLLDTAAFALPIVSGWGGPFISTCAVYTALIVAASVSAIGALAVMRPGTLRFLLSVAMIGGAVVFSVLPCVVNQGILPYRTLLGTPIALAGVVFCAGQLGVRSLRILMVALAALSFIAFAQIGARLYYSNHIAWLNDRGLGQAILSRIDALEDLPSTRPIPVEFSGFHDWPKSNQIIDVGADSVLGTSFFAWDGGNPDRILEFLKTLGRFDLWTIPPDRRRAIRPSVDAMPSWPRPGSVRVIDGVVVVRFGPYSQWQEDTLFHEAPASPH